MHLLVSNAGVVIPGTVEQIDADSYRAMSAINIDGAFFASRAALPHLRVVRERIVNVGFPRPALRGRTDPFTRVHLHEAVVGSTLARVNSHKDC